MRKVENKRTLDETPTLQGYDGFSQSLGCTFQEGYSRESSTPGLSYVRKMILPFNYDKPFH